MASEKKGFVLYFDSYHSIASLPAEQRGWLFSAIFAYAMQAAEQPERSWEEVLTKFTELEEHTKLILQFICRTIARDTEKWRQQRAARIRRREEKKQQEDNGNAWDYV